jgi:hypothetical protein
MFPYEAIHSKEDYYEEILKLVKSVAGIPSTNLPGKQPFASCKRLLRLYVAHLWEEVEYLEAQSRMLSSLALAALFWVGLCFAELKSYPWHTVVVPIVVTSAVLTACGRRRLRETEYVYLNTILAKSIIEAGIKAGIAGEVQSKNT